MPEEKEFTYGGKRYKRVKKPMWHYKGCHRCFLQNPLREMHGPWRSAEETEALNHRQDMCLALRDRIIPNGLVSTKIPACGYGRRFFYEEIK